MSDWAGQPWWFRTPHWMNDCACRGFFNALGEPPPFYLWTGLPQTETYWKFLEHDLWLAPNNPEDERCHYWHNFQPVGEEIFQRVVLDIRRHEDYPDYCIVRLTVSHITTEGNVIYENANHVPALPWGDPNPRGTEYVYDSYSWAKIEGGFTAQPPAGAPVIVPRGAIPDWRWGEPIPSQTDAWYE